MCNTRDINRGWAVVYGGILLLIALTLGLGILAARAFDGTGPL
jgi:hypothetical protein